MGYRKLGRPTDQRKAMLRGLVTALLQHGSIVTTVTRAKRYRALLRNDRCCSKEADNFTTNRLQLAG